jgi:CheY-like chemotaxis protein/anti-sigma regulatory factor (Ser/Thr protein kinase)
VIVDERRLRQVLINLISNAIKFTPEGSVSVDVKYRNQVAYITITDSGIGIEQEDISRISEAFVRIANPLHQASGSGLGLAITQALIYCMGGDLRIESDIGVGSTFTVSLMLPSINEVTHKPLAVDRVIGYHGDPLKLMVVDDDPNQRRLLIDTLTPLGFDIVAVANGAACLKMLEQCSPKLFMLDISMPDMSGWELATELRERGVNVPLVMISAEADEGFGLDTEKPLHNDYLVKPINIRSLLSTLAYHLNVELKLEEPPAEKPMNSEKNDPVVIHELLSYLDIGYVGGFKQCLLEAEQNARLSSDLCSRIHEDLVQLKLTTIRSQLVLALDEN